MTSPRDAAVREELRFLVQEHGPRLLSIARRYGGTEADAEDLLQEMWMRATRRYHRRNPEAPVAAWLTVLAVNVAREWRKKEDRRKGRLRRLQSMQATEEKVSAAPDEGALRGGMARLWNAVDTLPDLQRSVVLLRIYEGLSTKKTAQAVDRAEGTVKASLHAGIRSLRASLADLEPLWTRDEV